MFKSILKYVGRILIILAVASLIAAGLHLLFGSASQANPLHGFDGGGFRPEGHEGGEGSFGIFELIKNIGVIGLIIMVYWFIQNGIGQLKRKVHPAF